MSGENGEIDTQAVPGCPEREGQALTDPGRGRNLRHVGLFLTHEISKGGFRKACRGECRRGRSFDRSDADKMPAAGQLSFFARGVRVFLMVSGVPALASVPALGAARLARGLAAGASFESFTSLALALAFGVASVGLVAVLRGRLAG